MLRRHFGDGGRILLPGNVLDHLERTCDSAGWIADGQSDPNLSRIDRQNYAFSHAHLKSMRIPSQGTHGIHEGVVCI